MEKLNIICVDDQREVLNAVTQDLGEFESKIRIEECESMSEAWDMMEAIDAKGDFTAIVITDQVMPKNTGVDLLKKIKSDSRFKSTRTILLTGLATHQDTIEAINNGDLDYYVEKPWNKEELHRIIKVLLTKFIFKNGIDYREYTPVIDQKKLFEYLRKQS
jgi:two-component system chemotaxis response regulator CheY